MANRIVFWESVNLDPCSLSWDMIQARPVSRPNLRTVVRKKRKHGAVVGTVQQGCQRKVWFGKRVVSEYFFLWGIFVKGSVDARKETNHKTKPIQAKMNPMPRPSAKNIFPFPVLFPHLFTLDSFKI